MLDIGFVEITVVVIIALLVFGPERLPEVARTVGKWMARWRKLWASVKHETEESVLKTEKKE